MFLLLKLPSLLHIMPRNTFCVNAPYHTVLQIKATIQYDVRWIVTEHLITERLKFFRQNVPMPN